MIDYRERGPDLLELIHTVIDARLSRVMTAMPVKVTKDSDGHTVSLQPLVKTVVRQPDGSDQLVTRPVMDDAPVHFASGGGGTRTHAIKSGDEGIAIIAALAFDNWHQQGDVQQPSDARGHSLSDAFYVPGVRSDPRKISDVNTEAAETRTDDGQHRIITHPKNGVQVTINGGQQTLTMDAVSGALSTVAKAVTIKSGTPLAGDTSVAQDLNNQLKGLAARLAQAENHVHALFDQTSLMRSLLQGRNPEVAALAGILNQAPSGLTAMVAAVNPANTQAYLQTAVQAALGKFLSPNIAGLASVLSGGVEAAITALQSQIADLIGNNPAVAAVDALQLAVSAVQARGASAAVTAAQLKPLQSQIDALVSANPIVATVADLRNQLTNLVSSAGPGLDFLGPQQRLVQGVVNSLHLSGG